MLPGGWDLFPGHLLFCWDSNLERNGNVRTVFCPSLLRHIPHPVSSKDIAGVHYSTCSLLWFSFKMEMRGMRKGRSAAHLPPDLSAELRRGHLKEGEKQGYGHQRGRRLAVLEALQSVWLWQPPNGFVAVWNNLCCCHWVWCVIHAFPPFLSFSFAIHWELSNSQEGFWHLFSNVTLISKSVCL